MIGFAAGVQLLTAIVVVLAAFALAWSYYDEHFWSAPWDHDDAEEDLES